MTRVSRPHLSRRFRASDIGTTSDQYHKSDVGGPMDTIDWSIWVDNRIGNQHPKALMFWRYLANRYGDRTTSRTACAALLNRAAEHAGLLPKGGG